MKTTRVVLVLATMAALLTMALFVGVAGAEPEHPPTPARHRGFVRWDPRILAVMTDTTEVITKQVTFSSTVDLGDVSLRVTRSLSGVITFGDIYTAGGSTPVTQIVSRTNYTVDVGIKVPAKPGRWNARGGAIMLVENDRRLIPVPLPVIIMGKPGGEH